MSDDDAPPFQLATPPGFEVSHIPTGNLLHRTKYNISTSQTRTPARESNETTLLILDVDSTTSSSTGTLPPTSPVFPPWGTTGRRRSLQCRSTRDTCSVVLGKTATLELPWYFFIQSVLKAASSSGCVLTWSGPTTPRKKARSASVTRAKLLLLLLLLLRLLPL